MAVHKPADNPASKSDRNSLRRARRYLLGAMQESEKENFEQAYFLDDALFAELCLAENELIDSHVAGRMNWFDRRRFRRHYLASPLRIARVEEAGQLMEAVQSRSAFGWRRSPAPTAPGRRAVPVLAAAACLAFLVGAGWLISRVFQVQSRLEHALQLLDNRARDSSAPSRPFLAIALDAGLERAAGGPGRVTIPAGVTAIQLDLKLGVGRRFARYRAFLRTPEGSGLWSQSGLRGGEAGDTVRLLLPADLFEGTDYLIELEGSDDRANYAPVASYRLGVVKE